MKHELQLFDLRGGVKSIKLFYSFCPEILGRYQDHIVAFFIAQEKQKRKQEKLSIFDLYLNFVIK